MEQNMSLLQTQEIIKEIKDFFEKTLARNLNLVRVSAPMFVKKDTGLNDNLTGVERPVSFEISEGGRAVTVEVVHSLAKWKRFALKKYNIPMHMGIYTDMNAIRAFEVMDSTHSIYVDQWDWEKVIEKSDRTLEFLKQTVESIYSAFLNLEDHLYYTVKGYQKFLAKEITFITSQELLEKYPNCTAEEREALAAKEHGSIFVIGIGGKLSDGTRHGLRSPDYDDWSMNGDIIIYSKVLDAPIELSSMGIRVTKESLLSQLTETENLDRVEFDYHRLLLEEKLPFTIGGGIGQSRICMLFMQKRHIGEVQASVWSSEIEEDCKNEGIVLL